MLKDHELPPPSEKQALRGLSRRSQPGYVGEHQPVVPDHSDAHALQRSPVVSAQSNTNGKCFERWLGGTLFQTWLWVQKPTRHYMRRCLRDRRSRRFLGGRAV